jgi:UDP-glucose 4-epimerase
MKSTMREMYSGKKVLITGGLGMIGSSLAHVLAQMNAYVTIADSMVAPFGANLFNIADIADKINVCSCDIRDATAVESAIKDMDIIFNLAGQVSHNDSLNDPIADAAINYIGHLNVLEAVRKYNSRAVVIHAGSRLQYGKTENISVSEDHPMRPLTPYALHKMAAEQMYLYYHRCFDIPVVLFRITNPYGPRGQIKHSKYCMINWFIRQVMEGKPVTVFGSGEQIRDYIYIDDLVSAMIIAAQTSAAYGEVFNLGSGSRTSFKAMAEMIVRIIGEGTVQYVPWPQDYINVETGDFVADIAKIQSYTKWRPQVALAAGILKTYEYYEKHKDHYC